MMCQRIGLPPISIIGLGRMLVSSEIRVPRPPAKRTAFIRYFPLRAIVGILALERLPIVDC